MLFLPKSLFEPLSPKALPVLLPGSFLLSFFPSLLPCSLPGSLLVLSLSAAVSDGVLAAASGGGASVEPGIGAVDDPCVRVGIGFVRAMPHTLHLHSITPSRVSVGCTMTVPASQLWSVLELPRRSVAPHCEHSRVWMPSSMQVAFVVVNHAPNLCPVLEIPRLSVAPQVVHSRFCMPSSVQVACVVVNQASKLCPLAGIVMVPPSAPQSSQTYSI